MKNYKTLFLVAIGFLFAVIVLPFTDFGGKVVAAIDSKVLVINNKDQAVPVVVTSSPPVTTSIALPVSIGSKYHLQTFSANKSNSDYNLNGDYTVNAIKGNWINVTLDNPVNKDTFWVNIDEIGRIDPK